MKNIPVHLIIFIILLAFSGISWVYRQLKAQQALKRIRDREQQRQLEALRTGRDPAQESFQESRQDSAESLRQRELAARREAQLAELRRRAQERARQQSTDVPRPPTVPQHTPPPIPQHIPGSTGPTVAPARVAPRQTARVQSQSLPSARGKSRQSGAPGPAPRITSHQEEVTLPPRPVAAVIQVNSPRTPEEWRRAIITNEIMSPPLALREAPPSLPF